MIIDVIIILLAVLSLCVGWRKGFIVQLLQLIGLYVAILLAPDFAESVGEFFSGDPGLAYLIGFVVIILVAWILIRIVAPLLRKVLIFDFLKNIDSLLGMALSFVAMVVITSVVCSLFVAANVGDMRAEKLLEFGSRGLGSDAIEEYAELLQNKDMRVREFFEPKYVAYETLDESVLFNRLAAFGEVLCPELEDLEEDVYEWAISVKSKL